MFEFLTETNKNDAIVIIKDDHDKVKGLFDKFKKAETLRQKKKIVAEAIMELKIHATIEEEIFYPSMRKQLEKDMMNEADEEHHVAKLLIAELEQMDGSEDHWATKFTVLAENIRHHIKEEESEMLPKARELDIDFNVIGQQLLVRKQQLKKNGIPACAEEKLISTYGIADSPARMAKTKHSFKIKKVAKKTTIKPSVKVIEKTKRKAG